MTRPPAVYLGDHRVLLWTKNRYKMFVDSRDVSIAPHLILEGVYEEHTDAALKSLIKPGMRILEIGANVGLFTLLMCHRTGSSGSVLAYECDPVLAQLVRDNIEVNGFSRIGTVVEEAVSDSIETLTFHATTRHRGGGTLVEGLQQIPELTQAERQSITVQATTIDAIMREHPQGFDFVKIDVEGAESAVVRAGHSLFADRTRPLTLMMEFAPPFIRRAGSEPQAMLDQFAAWGFAFNRIDDRKRKIAPVAASELLACEFADIVLVRR